jgi:hypothetical protein
MVTVLFYILQKKVTVKVAYSLKTYFQIKFHVCAVIAARMASISEVKLTSSGMMIIPDVMPINKLT